MSRKSLNETEICEQYITPAIHAAGWDKHIQVRREYFFTDHTGLSTPVERFLSLASLRSPFDHRMAAMYGYHMSESIKTTVYLDAADYRRLQAVAKAQGRSAAELVREAVALYARDHVAPKPSSIALGRSGRDDLSENAELLLDGMGRER